MSNERTNLSAVIYGAHDLCMEPREIPEPQVGEVQINVRATGICGSDIHYYKEGGLGPRRLSRDKPMILGHESAGIITKVGEGVRGLQIGDRVAIEPGRSCGVCARCREGRYNLCPDMKFSASLLQGPNDGTLREWVTFSATLCHKMPESMTFEEGALMEPLAVAVHSVRRTQVNIGDKVVVMGAGPIGLLVAAVARAQGATSITLLDINASRLNFARTYLAPFPLRTIALTPKPCDSDEDNLDWSQRTVAKLEGVGEADHVFECTGAETCVQMAVLLARRGGCVVLIGMGASKQTLPVDVIGTREVDVKGNFRYANAYPKAIALVSTGAVSVKELVSHRFPLSDTIQAFELLKSGAEGVVKVQIGSF